mgnify:CR=1 FL=1
MGVIARLLAILMLLLTLPMSGQDDDAYIFHEVQNGETKYGISRQYDITIEQLEKFNPEIKSGLKEGLTLLIPKKRSEAVNTNRADQEPGWVYHKVEAGETLYSLARTYGVSQAELQQANPELAEGLKLGMTLKIPLRATEKPTAKRDSNYAYHRVEKDETAYSLSKEYNISLDSLYLLNPEASDGLKIGQVLKLPLNRKDSGAVVVTNERPKDGLEQDEKPVVNQSEPSVSDTTDAYLLYQVKTGDSFFFLKQKFNVTREELIALNPELARGLELEKYIIVPRKEEQTETSFLDRIFNKVEEPEPYQENVSETQRDRKYNLNNPETEKPREIVVDIEDTLSIDITRNYLVGLMLPFFVMDVDSIDPDAEVDSRSKVALEFYNGFLMAADSLSKAGMHLTLNVFDTKNSPFLLKEKITEIRKTGFDLIVGPLFKDNVEYVADELKKDRVPVISPLSKTVEVKNRPNLVQCIPGALESDAKMAEMLNGNFSNARIIFSHTGKADEIETVKQIKARLKARDKDDFIDNAVLQGGSISRSTLRESMAGNKRNVFVITTEDKVFLSDIISKLRLMRDTSIYVVGSSRLNQITTLEPEYLNDLHLTMPNEYFVDYTDPETVKFIRKYRERYQNEPMRYAFQGYDVGMYFLNKLWKTGKYMLYSLDTDQESYTNTGFRIRKTPDGGYRNEFMYVTGIRNMSLIKL